MKGSEVPVLHLAHHRFHGSARAVACRGRPAKWRNQDPRSEVPFPFLASDLANRVTWRAVPDEVVLARPLSNETGHREASPPSHATLVSRLPIYP